MKEFFVPQKFDAAILDYVSDHDNCIKTDIYRYLGLTGRNATKKVDRLIDLGLMEERNYGRYNVKKIRITAKGRLILRRMIDLDDIMKGRVAVPPEDDDRNHASTAKQSSPSERWIGILRTSTLDRTIGHRDLRTGSGERTTRYVSRTSSL